MRTLSPARAAPTKKRSTQRKPATQANRRRFDSALPRFSLVSRLPSVQGMALPRWNWQLPRIQLRWEWGLALLLGCAFAYLLYWTQSSDRFFIYRERVAFENVGYLNADELYQQSEIDTWNVFWLRSETVRQRLMRNPFVADAQVTIDWPAQVKIRVSPTEPVAVWMSGKGRFWLMRNGFTRPMERDAIPALPQIVDQMLDARTTIAPEEVQMQQGILDAILALHQRISGLSNVNYNNQLGINFALPDSGYYVYWGDERNFEKKLINLDGGKRMIASGQSDSNTIDVRTADRPIIR